MIYLLFQMIQLVLLYCTCLGSFIEQPPLVIHSSDELFLSLRDGEEMGIYENISQKCCVIRKLNIQYCNII